METTRLIDEEVSGKSWLASSWHPGKTAVAAGDDRGGYRYRTRREFWLLHGCLLLLSSMLAVVGISSLVISEPRRAPEVMWSPILDAVSVQKTRFNETFMYPTKFASKFSNGLASEDEWRRWTANPMLDGRDGTIAVSAEVVERIAPMYTSQWKDSLIQLSHGGETRYMGQIAMFHHLHCLNILRHAVHPELYGAAPGGGHLDHCIESLREVLMCNPGGTEVILFHWMEDSEKPYPDYNTFHQCRDPGAVLDWALEHAVKIRGPLTKPSGVFAMQDPPY
ncbi:hypothetical protein Z517_01602 [Fonsecaea pedrosoi CBS 271.37]|uniref:Tat pathway signal sequence n=1 Tax=Fonsecaea pedrosoi CBS 271.37 TaxID=1442368 RepID=A0A0D2FHP2_9EURO|nr:uncharacterized protein Z517_01602 [Fonsecaea pedrosoi CBS 271.37]KIW86207.1 hypothetical protein Z517_01602 [Fonsecaea pedrosoi CBS 271.37]